MEASSPRAHCSSSRDRVGEADGELVDDIGDQAVGLVDAFPGIVDETRLDGCPSAHGVRASSSAAKRDL